MMIREKWRDIVVVIVTIGSATFIFSLEPITQNLSYHNFADQRTFFSIQNCFDVLSNIPFLFFGLTGFSFAFKNKQQSAPFSWQTLFIGVTFVCFGSAYYHWAPDNDRLVWDRLPMTIGFMGLFIGLLAEHINSKIERSLLLPAIIAGIASVVYWHFTDDLRFYIWIQAVPLLTIPIVLIIYHKNESYRYLLLVALALYLIAKITESYDHEIFDYTKVISGHTLKHLLASLATGSLYLFIKKRRDNYCSKDYV